MIPKAMHCRHYWNDSQIFAFAKRYVANRPTRSWVDLPTVGGFAFIIRRSVWEKFGGFDRNLPDYGNESELCRRITKSGLRVVWTQNSYIHHFGHQSYGRLGEEVITRRARTARAYIDRMHSIDK
jgi:GT2 family glycosyltransferase